MKSDYDARQVRIGAARRVGSWVAHGLMAPFSLLPSSHQRERKENIRTLVFVHGLAGNRSNFYPLQSYLWWKGYRRQLSFNYLTTGSIERCGIELKERIDSEIKGGRIDLICHSMGGLVGRVYLQMLGGDRRVDRFITLGTPHHGSEMSAWAPSPLVSQLAPSGPFIEHLNSLPPPDVRTLAIEGGKDIIVLPTRSAQAPFGENHLQPNVGHLDMLLSPAVFRTVRMGLL